VYGDILADRLHKVGFVRLRQSGSHIVLRHETSGETISVPAHRPLKAGTLARILRDVLELTGLTREDLYQRLDL
jgi:predicted RNA binding protein YcfA (HicA-like mRNA interferase family)